MDVEVFMLFQVASVAMASLEDFFIETDQNGAWCKFVSRPKCWSFGILAALPQQLHYWEQFQTTFTKFQELMTVVVPNIINHARSTKEVGKLFGQPCKLTPKQCLLNFILYFKHDNVTMQDTFMWNWFKTSICDEALFILPCINEAIVDDIQWSILEERVTLTRRIPNLLGCISLT
jgi:hypothetical protein